MDVEEARAEEEQEIQDEAEPLKMARDPKLPSAADVEIHDRTHIPFRDWCKWCNCGRGRGIPHTHGRGSAVPRVGVDYFFITSGGVKKRAELEFEQSAAGEAELLEARTKGEIVKCLVIRCMASKNVRAHHVPVKGADEEDFAANLVASMVLWLGHLEVNLKGDNEPALQALIERTLRVLRIKVQEEDPEVKLTRMVKDAPAAYDSQSNGGIEVGVMLVRGLFRILKLCLESHLERFIPIHHPVVSWLLEHACFLLNIMTRGSDGHTPWARIKGRPFGLQSVGFDETVLFKHPTKGPQESE